MRERELERPFSALAGRLRSSDLGPGTWPGPHSTNPPQGCKDRTVKFWVEVFAAGLRGANAMGNDSNIYPSAE